MTELTNEKKEKYQGLLKVAGWVLSGYLFVNLVLYFMGMINGFVFWGSLIVIGIVSAKVIPNVKRKVHNM